MLSDFLEGSLSPGWHDVTVESVEAFTSRQGNPAIRFICRADDGRTVAAMFTLVGQGARFLARFARACGMSDSELKTYDENSMEHHERLLNRPVKILLEKNGDYLDPVDYRPSDSTELPDKEASSTADAPTDDDIPF